MEQGCTDNPDGTYTVASSTNACTMGGAKTITIAGDAITMTWVTAFYMPNPYSSISNVVIDGDKVTFDAAFDVRNTDSGDDAGGDEYYVLTAGGNALKGTVDGMYGEMYNGNHTDCTSMFDISFTRS